MAEVLLISAGASGILNLVRSTIDKSASIPDIVWLVGVGVVLGLLTILFLTRFFSGPISTLGNAVKRVANGDFTVRLRTDKGFREIREINENFNAMVKELGATEILQTDFVSNVSHEFKTPITAIEGYVTLLGDSYGTTPEQQKYIEKILLNTNRLSTLVGNILLLSKIDNQGIQSRASTFRLDEQIRSSIVELEPKWTEKNCELDVDMEELIHTGNENLLIHVWKNLIENAIKFGPKDSTIRITLQKKKGKAVFTVTDEGEGISDEDKCHVFDRFYQSDSSHKSEGNGLGLALVKQIVDAEGGEVSVCDGEGGGCKFTVVL
ncbi:MAG: HAMP domain-containing histidine kinase [Clostridia bacterium]|nr:HAMP domain-containing histidine kinase [Clostridia bacterium]